MTQQTVFDREKAEQAIREALATIETQAQAAWDYREAVVAAMAALEAEGMSEAVPSEGWEARGAGPKKYLYHYWRFGTGGHEGPGGKRRTYVGCSPETIAEARRMVENRRRWRSLKRTLDRLDGWLEGLQEDVADLIETAGDLAKDSGGYPCEDLGSYVPAELAPLVARAAEDVRRRESAAMGIA